MIVNDAPSRGRLAQDQREDAGRAVALQLQPKAATHQGVIGAEQLDRQLRERELAHLLALALVFFPIAFERRLPTLGLVVTREERQLLGFEVALHEADEI